MAGHCSNSWCTYYTQIVFNTAICPYCLVELTPVMPSYAAHQPIDAGVPFSSLIPSASWGLPPVHNEQMDHMSNNDDMCSPVAYPIPRSPDRNSFLDSQAPSTPSSNEGLGNHKEQQNLRKERAWVDYSRSVAEKGAKETCSPACISCYNTYPCYRGSSADCCVACSGKNKYCQGIVQLPELITNRLWHKDALAHLKSKGHSLDRVGGRQAVFSLDIYVNSASKKERCDVNLTGLNDNLPIPDDLSSLERVLDLVFPADQKTSLDDTNQASQLGQADIGLELLETFTRRFIACLTLLRTPALCTFDERLWKHPAAPYVMLEFLRQLSHEACDLFQHIASEVDRFANSRHKKKSFTKAKGSIAFKMGIIHTSIQSFTLGRYDWYDWAESHFMPESLYDLTPEVLGQLQWLGRGFNQIRFEQGKKALHIEHTGIHIAFPLLQDFIMLAGGSSNRRYSFVNVFGSIIPLDLGPSASEPPVRVVQSNASALQPQNQEHRITADRLHAEPELEPYESIQDEQYTLDCDTTGDDTQSTTSPLENSLTSKYRKDSEPEAIPLPPETKLKSEQELRHLELQYTQTDTTIRQLQIRKATLEKDIETCKYGLALEPRQTRTKPNFTEMDKISEATVLVNDDSEAHRAGSSVSVSCSGKTTAAENNDDLDRRVGPDYQSRFCDPMDITIHDTEARASTSLRDVASQPMLIHQPQPSKRPNPHGDANRPSKRKRISVLSSKRPFFTPIVHQTTDNLETEAEHAEKAGSPITNHRLGKNRLSQLLHFKPQTQRDPEEGLMVINSSRPKSYPLASLWRRSAVVSVKAITEAFESLHLATNSTTPS